MASRNLSVLYEVAQGIRWFVTDEVCLVASRALSIINQLDKEVNKYRNEAGLALQKLAKATAEHNQLDNQYTTNLKNLDNKFHELEAAYNSDIAQRDSDLALVREQYGDLQHRFSKQQEQASQLHQQKVDFQHQASHLQTKVKELTNTLTKEQEHSNHLRQQKVDLQNQVNQLMTEQERAVETNEALKKKYADLWSQFEKLSLVKERLEVAERELDEKHKVVLDVSDHLVEALQVAGQALEKARLEAASLRSL